MYVRHSHTHAVHERVVSGWVSDAHVDENSHVRLERVVEDRPGKLCHP